MKRLIITVLILVSLWPVPAAAEELVADLSDHLVEITMGFEGAELLLFGAVDEARATWWCWFMARRRT